MLGRSFKALPRSVHSGAAATPDVSLAVKRCFHLAAVLQCYSLVPVGVCFHWVQLSRCLHAAGVVRCAILHSSCPLPSSFSPSFLSLCRLAGSQSREFGANDMAEAADTMANRCHYCKGLSINHLVELAVTEMPWRRSSKPEIFPENYYQHHGSIKDLEDSAVQGCDLCQFFLDRFKVTVYDEETSETFYAAIKTLSVTDIKISFGAAGIFDGSSLPVLDMLVLQVGHAKPGVGPRADSVHILNYASHRVLRPLCLSVSISRGM